MATSKTAPLILRVGPGLREALYIAAGLAHRFIIVIMDEVLLHDHRQRCGMAVAPTKDTKNDHGVRL